MRQWVAIACIIFLVSCGGGGGGGGFCCSDELQIKSFSAASTEVERGDQVTMTWSTSGADQCALKRTFEGAKPESEAIVNCNTTHTESPDVPSDATYAEYTLKATSAYGDETTATLRITFIQPSYSTAITEFNVHPLQVGPGEAVTISWEAINTGTYDGVASCSLSRRAESQTAGEATTMSTTCKGSITEVPDAPSGATYVRYQLNALKDVFEVGGDPTQAYVYADSTVQLLAQGFNGDTQWQVQFGTALHDEAFAVAVDPTGSVTIAGVTHGVLEESNAGEGDAFIRSFHTNGVTRWTRQFGTASYDYIASLDVDDEYLYVLGFTAGGSHVPRGPFLRKYTSLGDLVWEEHPTPDDAYPENVFPSDVAVDREGTIYIVGQVYRDGFLLALDTNGNELWSTCLCLGSYSSTQSGTSDTQWTAIAIDGSGDLFVGGWTTDSIYAENEGSQSNATADALIAKVGPDGALYWGVQTGSSDHDEVNDIAVSAHGTVALGGTTSGGIEGQPVGGEDAFVMLLSAEDGSLVWTKQFGSGSSGERVMSVAFDSFGNVVAGSVHSGSMWVDKYYPNGDVIWSKSLGSEPPGYVGYRRLNGLDVDVDDAVLVAGATSSEEFGPHFGDADGFVLKLRP